MGDDLAVLGFPCNQFGLQEPGANATEILNGIAYVRPGGGFQPNFQMFAKTDVNGDDEHPLFTFLKSRCPSTRTGFSDKHSLEYNRFLLSDVRWNFEKFLVSKEGQPVRRYDPSTEPLSFQQDVVNLIQSAPSVFSNRHH